MKDSNADVRSAVTFIAGVQGERSKAVAASALKDRDPAVRRRAAEALVRMGQSPDKPSLAPAADVYALLNDQDRFVRWAGRIAIEHTARAEWKDRVLAENDPLGALDGMLAWVRTANGESLQPLIDKQLALLKQTNLSTDNKLRLYRTLMYTATEVKDGLSARAAAAAERSNPPAVPRTGRAHQSRAGADARVLRASPPRSRRSSRQCRRRTRIRSCSSTTCTRCA